MVLTDADLDKCGQSGIVDVTDKYGLFANCNNTKTQGDLTSCAMHRKLLEHCGVQSVSRRHANEVIHTADVQPGQTTVDNGMLEVLLDNSVALATKRCEELKIVSQTEADTVYYTQYPEGHHDPAFGDGVYNDIYHHIHRKACISMLKFMFDPLVRAAINSKVLHTANRAIFAAKQAWRLVCGAEFKADDLFRDVESFVNIPSVNDWIIYYLILGNCSWNTMFLQRFPVDFHVELARALLCAAPTFTIRRLMQRTPLHCAWDSMLDMQSDMPRNWPYNVEDYCARLLFSQNDTTGGRNCVLIDDIVGTPNALLMLQRLEDGIRMAEESFRQRLLAEIRSRQKLVLFRMLTDEKHVLISHSRYAWMLELPMDDELRRIYEQRFPQVVSAHRPRTPEQTQEVTTKLANMGC